MYKEWVNRLLTEYKKLGEKEESSGLPYCIKYLFLAALTDPKTINNPSPMQTSFLNAIVKPTYELLSKYK